MNKVHESILLNVTHNISTTSLFTTYIVKHLICFLFSESPINGNRNINNTTSSPISEKIEVPPSPQSPATFSPSALEERNSYQSVFANSLTNGGGNRNNGGVQQPQYSEIHKTPPSPTTVPLM